ncbi:DUF6308 family protein [Streptomyces liliiviolaceus]|uniref:DUF6308 family protein n=1 Tax=Streptomyces liliiviolaceus TaxID=2823109 RepID=UPI001FFD0278|nr:DUF6308 family protein [Streptomyces liliiviolaceus]
MKTTDATDETATAETAGATGLPPSLAGRLHAFIEDSQASTDLRRYYGIGLSPGAAAFTGSRFEHLAGGGDLPETADAMTAADLIAVQTLSVTVPADAALNLLEGSTGRELSEHLRAIPADVDMAECGEGDLGTDSPADRAWGLLHAQPGIGWVTAGKLLARKRPRLLPVYDRVVRCAVGRPDSYWLALHAALRADDRLLHRDLLALRDAAGLPRSVSALRVCDVVVWMRHRNDHQKASCVPR